MKASFFERAVAYLMDIIIISAIVSILVSVLPIPDTTSLQTQITTYTQSYADSKIGLQEYISDVSNLYYQMDSQTMLVTIISVFLSVLYFMYYQFKNDGKTIGKQIMKIKIIKDKGTLELNDLVIRSLLIDGILCSMILLVVIFITPTNVYYLVKSGIEGIQFIFMMVCSFMILFRIDKKGWHDIICHTSVISYREEATK